MGPMVNVALALLATLAALGGAGLLIYRTLPDRQIPLVAWCATLALLGLALAAMTTGFATGFGPTLLRVLELFGSLLAPMTLAVGVVELVARTVQARFATRLVSASYAIVAVVIILLDPIIGTFGKSLPDVGGHYSSLPGLILDGAHVFAIVALVSCVAVTAVRSNQHDREAAALMAGLAMVAGSGVLIVVAMRGFLPDPLAPLALGGASALVWFGVDRLPNGPHEDDNDDQEYEDMSRYPQQPYQDDPRYGRQPDEAPRGGQSGFAPPPMPFGLPGQYGRITIYTLLDGHAEEFDRLASEVAYAVRENEPGIVVYSCHSVDNSPEQRLFYQLFRDGRAVEEHSWQPHVQRFAQEARAHVAGTNVIELTVNAGNVALPPGPPEGMRTGPQQPPAPGYPQDGRTGPRPQPGYQPGPPQDGRTGPRPMPQSDGHTGPRPMPHPDGHTGPRPMPRPGQGPGPGPRQPGPPPDGRTGPHPGRWSNG